MERKVCEHCGEYYPPPGQSLCTVCQADAEWDDMGEGDDPVPLEPEEGDYTTGDHRTFYQYGKVVLRVPEGEDWGPLVRAHMEQEQFWPAIWFIDDHGGYTPLSLDN